MCGLVLLASLLFAALCPGVSGSRGSTWAHSEPSFTELAALSVPTELRAVLALLPSLNTTAGPWDVKPLRVSILMARVGLDVFSPVLPPVLPRSGEHKDAAKRTRECHDVWQALRDDLDEGYKVLGEFQDLAHSGVAYEDRDVVEGRKACLAWQGRMRRHSDTYHYQDYVNMAQLPQDRFYTHKHTSRLFWGYRGAQPCMNLSGLDNVALLVGSSQLPQLRDTYPGVLALRPDDLLHAPGHERFHSFRKLLRSILAVLHAFPQLLQPPPSALSPDPGAAADAGTRAAGTAVARTHMGGGDGGGGGAGCGPEAANVAVKTMEMAFHDLGKVNDKVFAYHYYMAKGKDAKGQEARRAVVKGWRDEVAWMRREQLDGVARCLATALPLVHGATPQRAPPAPA